MIQERHSLDPATVSAGDAAGDRGTIALAGVRAARGELCRAAGLLRRAIRLAAAQDVSAEQLARAAGSSIEQVRRIATEPDDVGAARVGTGADRDGRGDRW